MRSPRLAVAGAVATVTATVAFGLLLALPAFAGPVDPSNPTDCPEGSQKNCVIPSCPGGVTQPAPGVIQCDLGSLVLARARAEVLTPDQLVNICVDAKARNAARVRIVVRRPELVVIDGKACDYVPPAATVVPTTPLPEAPTAPVVPVHLPVTH